METKLTELLHLLTEEELIRLERRALLADCEDIAKVLSTERERRAAKELVEKI